jgi:hypothetical protein
VVVGEGYRVSDVIRIDATADDAARPRSSLDGFSLVGIDVDPDDRLRSMIAGSSVVGLEIVAILPRLLHGTTRGYLVLVYDRARDPRAVTP